MSVNLYTILGVDKYASQEQIDAAYNALKSSAVAGGELAGNLELAYSVLGNIERRAYYDVYGRIPKNKQAERRGSKTEHYGKMSEIRKMLNMVFLFGSVISIVLFIVYITGGSPVPFYWACGASLVIKITEYVARLF